MPARSTAQARVVEFAPLPQEAPIAIASPDEKLEALLAEIQQLRHKVAVLEGTEHVSAQTRPAVSTPVPEQRPRVRRFFD